MAILIAKLVSLVVILFVCSAITSTEARGRNRTDIQFYMHETLTGLSPTAVLVAARSNYTGSNLLESIFGSTYVIDNPLRSSGDANSSVLGYAQGMYAMASKTEPILFISATYTFTTGEYNGSSFSMLGVNPVLSAVREMPIIGGTRKFRFGEGYCLVRTHSVVDSNNVIGYNVTLFHF